jgi:hypothetical protein
MSSRSVRLGVAHELGFAIATTLSIVIVLLGGELPLFAWLLCGAPWLSFALAWRGRSAPALSATLVGVAGIALGVVTIFRGGVESSLLAGAEVLLALLAARLLVRETATHDLQALTLSLLLVLSASALNVTISYVVVFVPYAVAVVWALATRQLLAVAAQGRTLTRHEREAVRRRVDVVTPSFFVGTAAVSLAVLASAAIVFAAFPRVGFGDIGAFLMKETKLPKAVGLRGDPRVAGSNKPVARVRGVPRDAFDDGLYLRGVVYDALSLDGFSQTAVEPGARDREGPVIRLADAPRDGRYEMAVMPVVGDTLLTLGGVVAVRGMGGGTANPNLSLGIAGRTRFDELKAIASLTSPMRYEVAGGFAQPGFVPGDVKRKPRPLSDDDRARWTQMPSDFDAQLAALAASAAGPGSESRAVASSLRRFFLSQFVYSQTPPRFASAPLRTFLLEDRQGHCEYFASSFALLLRSRGIPARVVGGFQGGAWDEDVIVFQERHAHAWVEWWDDEAGWIVDDATPLATAAREDLVGLDSVIERVLRFWDDRVLDYSMQDQSDALTSVRRAARRFELPAPALAGVGALAVLVVVAVVRRRRTRRARRDPGHVLAEAIVAAIARATRTPVATSHTVREAVDEARPLLTESSNDALRAALALYERERFGGDAIASADRQRALRSLRTVRSRRTGGDSAALR